MTTWIAEERVVFVLPSGERREGRIAIGMPELRETDAQCHIALDGLEKTYRIYGVTPLHALMLAIQFAGYRLHDFVDRGGKVLFDDDGEPITHEAALARLQGYFGPLLCHPPRRDDHSASDA